MEKCDYCKNTYKKIQLIREALKDPELKSDLAKLVAIDMVITEGTNITDQDIEWAKRAVKELEDNFR